MKNHSEQKVLCGVCGQEKDFSEVMPAEMVRPMVAEIIRKKNPDWKGAGYICLADLHRFRIEYIESLLETERGELSSLEKKVVESMKGQEILSENINTPFERELSFGERLSDRIAEFGGSWGFLIFFSLFLATWIAINTYALFTKPFDPYPYIFLNLIFSCMSAIQAPIILMSQKRQDAKDRLRSEYDYQVSLKAEMEIRHLNEKMDHLLMRQWQRLMELQKIQVQILDELLPRMSRE
jgi:uncharacterized membrane protein